MFVSIDVGASKTLLAVFEDNEIKKQVSFSTNKDPGAFLKDLLRRYKKLTSSKKIKAIGLGLPCSIDSESKSIRACGNLDWKGFNIIEQLETKVKKPVFAQNDAVLGGLAEASIGAGKDYRVVLYVTVSTGVGTGIIVDKKILPELAKSEGGMMVFATKDQVYKRLEDLVAGPEFKDRFGKYGFDVIDPNIWKAFAKDLAAGLFNMITLIQPDVVVLGGGMSVHFNAFRKPLLTYVEQLNPGLYPMPPIKQARFVETAVIYGGYLLARQKTK